MTPAAFTKLGLRLLAAYLLLFVIPWSLPSTIINIRSSHEGALGIGTLPYESLQAIKLLILAGIALVLWFRADRLLRYILPAGADMAVPTQYAGIQSVASLFIGGILVLHAGQYLLEYVQSGDHLNAMMAGFDFAVAIVLIVGWRTLLGAPLTVIRNFTRLRAKP